MAKITLYIYIYKNKYLLGSYLLAQGLILFLNTPLLVMVYVIRISTTKTFQSFLKFSKYYICNQESPSFLEHAYLWMQICTNAFSYYEFLNASLHIIIEV